MPAALRFAGTAALGACAATAVGLLTSENPAAQPAGVAVEIRVVMIVALIAAGLYAQTSKIQARMGGRLIAVGLLSSLWLLNGSSNRVLFSVGVVFTGLMPLVFAYLMLAHPTGHLPSRTELRFLWLTGGALAMLWLLGIAMTLQPPLTTPLLRCGPHCPDNVFSLGSATDAVSAVQAAMVLAWLGGHLRHPGAAGAPGTTGVGSGAALAHAGVAHGRRGRRPVDREHAVPRRGSARMDDARCDLHRPRGDPPARDPGRARQRTAVHGAGAGGLRERAGQDAGGRPRGADGGGASRPVAQGRLPETGCAGRTSTRPARRSRSCPTPRRSRGSSATASPWPR